MTSFFSETNALKYEPACLVADRIVIFCDHTGSERFLLRFDGTTHEFQVWLERWANRSDVETDWAAIVLKHCE
jgi:hypothetical protein